MERPTTINLSLESIEQQIRALATNGMYSHYFTEVERVKLEKMAHEVAKIRFPFFVKPQKEA